MKYLLILDEFSHKKHISCARRIVLVSSIEQCQKSLSLWKINTQGENNTVFDKNTIYEL